MDSGKERGISAFVAGVRDLRNSSDSERFRDCSSICQIENPANAYILNCTSRWVEVAPNLRSLFRYLIENRYIEEITDYRPEYLRIYPPDALAKLQSGDSTWERMVSPEAVEIIKEREFFGYSAPVAA